MTVPMSRPSSTAPGGRAAKLRCRSTSAARTSGIAETIEAASPIACGPERRFVEARRIERVAPPQPRARDRRAHGRRRAAPSPPRGRSGRCRGGAARNGRRAAWPSVPLPDAAGPSMAMIMRDRPIWLLRAPPSGAGAAERPFLGEDVARAEFRRADEGQVFAHAGAVERRRVPWPVEVPFRRESPFRDGGQIVLPGQILRDGARQCIEARIAGRRRRLVMQRLELLLGVWARDRRCRGIPATPSRAARRR